MSLAVGLDLVVVLMLSLVGHEVCQRACRLGSIADTLDALVQGNQRPATTPRISANGRREPRTGDATSADGVQGDANYRR